MLLKASTIIGCSIRATDGEIGSVTDLLFDDERWAIRWVVVDVGSWLSDRRVLLPSSQLGEARSGVTAISVDLTRDQVEGSPDIDNDRPVSRQMERSLYEYYGWAPYWPVGGAYVPPLGYAGAGLAYPLAGTDGRPGAPLNGTPPGNITRPEQPPGDPHLRSVTEVTGYYIEGSDDDVGHVEDFLVEASNWTVRYLVVDTRNWWPGKQVLIAPPWIGSIAWSDRKVRVNRTRQEIKSAPEYDPEKSADREYEAGLHTHYGATPYWGAVL